MHGVKRSLVCFVAVASANPPFIQPSETSRETTESMNDGLIKLIRSARFLLNTPTAQQNHPRARQLRALQRQPQPCGRADAAATAHGTPHTRPAARGQVCRVIQRPEGSVRFMVGPPLRGIEAEILLLLSGLEWGWSHVTSFFFLHPGSAASMERNGYSRPSDLILECGVDVFLFCG